MCHSRVKNSDECLIVHYITSQWIWECVIMKLHWQCTRQNRHTNASWQYADRASSYSLVFCGTVSVPINRAMFFWLSRGISTMISSFVAFWPPHPSVLQVSSISLAVSEYGWSATSGHTVAPTSTYFHPSATHHCDPLHRCGNAAECDSCRLSDVWALVAQML